MRISKTTIRYVVARALRLAMLCCGFAWISAPEFVTAQQPATAETEEAAEGETEEEEKPRPLLDLGSFQINDLRPMRNVTAKLTFSMHLALSESVTEQQLATLQLWQHRLRDQVITAVRISTVKDFQEPDLNRLRRVVQIRVNRLLNANVVEEVLLNEYLFRTN